MTDTNTSTGIMGWIPMTSVVSYASDTESDVDIVDAKHFLTDLDRELDAWMDTDIRAAESKNAKLREVRASQALVLSRLVQECKRQGAKRRRSGEDADSTGHKRQCIQVDFDTEHNASSLSSQSLKTMIKSSRLEALEAENEELERGNEKLARRIARLRRKILTL